MDVVLVMVAGLLGGGVGAAATAWAAGRYLRRGAEQQLTRIEHMLTAPDQAWYWTPQWQAGEAEADADLKAGRSIRFESTEEMDAYLASIPLPDTETASSGQQAR